VLARPLLGKANGPLAQTNFAYFCLGENTIGKANADELVASAMKRPHYSGNTVGTR
jgi:hypothetical protein